MLRRDLHIGSNNLPFLDQCGPYSPWQQQVKIRTMGLLFRYRKSVEKGMLTTQQSTWHTIQPSLAYTCTPDHYNT